MVLYNRLFTQPRSKYSWNCSEPINNSICPLLKYFFPFLNKELCNLNSSDFGSPPDTQPISKYS